MADPEKLTDRTRPTSVDGLMTIGEIARRVGIKVNTIRFYEEIGLLPPIDRTESGRRKFTEVQLQRLRFIRNSRSLGFSSDEIRSLLSLSDQPDRQCTEVTDIASAHLAAVNERIVRLGALRDELAAILARCHGGRICDCRVIEAIADLSGEIG